MFQEARPRMAFADQSISASVVDYLETAMRITCFPCHVDPPSQQVPSS
jgi:hypothetical protein